MKMKGVPLVVFLLILQAPFSSERPVLSEGDSFGPDEGPGGEETPFGTLSEYPAEREDTVVDISTEDSIGDEESNGRSSESEVPVIGFGIELPFTMGEKAFASREVQSQDESSDLNNTTTITTTKSESPRLSSTVEEPFASASNEALLEFASIEPKTLKSSTESLPASLPPTNENGSNVTESMTTESNVSAMVNSSRLEKITRGDSVSDLFANLLAEGTEIGSTTLEPTVRFLEISKNSASEVAASSVDVVPGTTSRIEQSSEILPSLFDTLLSDIALSTESTTAESEATISSSAIEFNPEMVGFSGNDTIVSLSQDVVPIDSVSEKSRNNSSPEMISSEPSTQSEDDATTGFDNESSTEEFRESTTYSPTISTDSITEGPTDLGASQSPLFNDGNLSLPRRTEGTSQSSLEFQAEFGKSINMGSTSTDTSSNPTDIWKDFTENTEFAGPDLNLSTSVPSQEYLPELLVTENFDFDSGTLQPLKYTSVVPKNSGIDLLSMSDGDESYTIDPELELTESTDKAKVKSFSRVSETTTSSNFNDSQQIADEVLKSVSPSTDEILGQLDSFKDSSDLLSATDILVSEPLEVKDEISSELTPELINVDLELESSTFEPSTSILDFTSVSLTTRSNFESSNSGVSSESSELEPIVKSLLVPTGPTSTFLRSSLSPSVTEPSFKPSTPIEPSPISIVVKDPRDRITEGAEFLTTTESPAFETGGEPTERLVSLLDNIDTTTETTERITFQSDQSEERQQSVPSELNFFQDPIELTSDTDLFSFDNVEGSAESNTTELEEDSEFYDDGEFDSIWNSADLVDYNFEELEGLGDIISDYGLSKESDDPDKKESQEDLWAKFDARFENKLKSPVDTLQDVGIDSGAIETVATLTDRSKDVGSVDGSHRRKPLVGSPTLKHEDVEEFQYKSLSPEDFHVGLSGDGHIRLGKYISFDEILEVQDVPDFTPLAQKVSNFTDYNHICQKCTLTGEIAFHNEDNQFDLIRTREFLIQVDNYLQRFFEDELAYTDNYVELGNATRFDQAVILDFNMTFTRPINESFVRNSFHSYLNEQTLADLEVIPNSSALVFQRFQINEPIVRTMGIEIKPPTYRSRLWLEVSIALMICLSISLIVLQHRKCQGILKELPPKSLAMIEKHINEANEFELALTNYNKTKAEEEPPKVVLEEPAEEVDEIDVSLMETQMVKGFGSNCFRPVEVVWAEKQSQSREVKSHTPESSKSQKPSKVPRKSKATCSQEVKPEIHAAPSEDGQTGEPTKSAARRQREPSVRPKQPYQPPTKPRRSSKKKEGSDSD